MKDAQVIEILMPFEWVLLSYKTHKIMVECKKKFYGFLNVEVLGVYLCDRDLDYDTIRKLKFSKETMWELETTIDEYIHENN
jgi:hypothetical protein